MLDVQKRICYRSSVLLVGIHLTAKPLLLNLLMRRLALLGLQICPP